MEIEPRSILLLFLLFNSAAAQNATRGGAKELHVGVILDLDSLVGKIARTSVSLAMEDFYAAHKNYSTKLVLHVRDSKSDDVQAASEEGIAERFLSRIVLIVWICFLLVVTSSYTASLSSILTVQQLQPTVADVHELLRKGECVGYHRGSYIKGVLEELGFDRSKIKPYTPDGFYNALSRGSNNGGIAALVHEVPHIKLFLAKHCKEYTMVGPIYKSAGFGFAFVKRNPLVGDFSRAILNITGGDAMIRIEKEWIAEQNNCQNVGTVTGSGSLTLANLRGLFILTGVASTSSLLIALIIYFYKKKPWSEKVMQEYLKPQQENGEDGENNEPEEGDGVAGGRVEETIQPGAGLEGDGQTLQQHGLEHPSNRSRQISMVMRSGSIIIHRGERTNSLQTESI